MEAHTGIHAIDASAGVVCDGIHAQPPAHVRPCWLQHSELPLAAAGAMDELSSARCRCSQQFLQLAVGGGRLQLQKYFANQENIDRYTGTRQPDSYLHVSYEDFPLSDIPESLHHTGIPADHIPAGSRAVEIGGRSSDSVVHDLQSGSVVEKSGTGQ